MSSNYMQATEILFTHLPNYFQNLTESKKKLYFFLQPSTYLCFLVLICWTDWFCEKSKAGILTPCQYYSFSSENHMTLVYHQNHPAKDTREWGKWFSKKTKCFTSLPLQLSQHKSPNSLFLPLFQYSKKTQKKKR